MNFKERMKAIRDVFNAAVAPVAAAISTPAIVPPVATGTEYTLADGVSKVTISKLEVGGTIAPAPAAEGSITLADGTVVSFDATGVITLVTPKAAEVATEQVMSTPEQMRAYLANFADDATPESTSGLGGTDIQKLALVVKALFEDRFGWELRRAQEEAQRAQAIEIYKTGFNANKEALEGLFEIVEKIADTTIVEATEAEAKAWDEMTPLEKFRATKIN